MKHTPTPLYNVGNRIFDAEKREMAVAVKACPSLRANAADRAAEIVEACNAHEGLKGQRDALLEAAQDVLDKRSRGIDIRFSIEDLEKAIALPEGGAE